MDVLDVESLAKLVQKKRRNFETEELNHWLAPQFDNGVLSFRMLVFGAPGRGKTNLAVSAILQGHIKFEHLYLYVRDPSQSKYQLLMLFVQALEDQYEAETGERKAFATVATSADQVVSIDKVNPNIINLAIFDDLMLDKDQTLIEEYYIRGRNKNMNCIYLTQDYHQTSSILRKASEYFVAFGVSSKAELVQLAKDHSLEYDFHQFKDLLNKATNPKTNFMLIDRRTDNPLLQIRKNWDQIVESTTDAEGNEVLEFKPIEEMLQKYQQFLKE
jgi:hypothetical protein